MHWSEQRQVKVSSDLAGNTWAPEATWDEATGQYVVYWASNLYASTDVASRNYATNYNRMMYVTTRDFVTFSDPQPWVDVKRGNGRGMIDANVVKDGDTYYRFIKDEASFDIRQEKSTDLKATVSGSLPTAGSRRLEPGPRAHRRGPAQPVGRHVHPGRGSVGVPGQHRPRPLVPADRPAELPRRPGLHALRDPRHRLRRLDVGPDRAAAHQPAPRHRAARSPRPSRPRSSRRTRPTTRPTTRSPWTRPRPARPSTTRCTASSSRTSTGPPTAVCTPSWCATAPSSSCPSTPRRTRA